MCKNCIKLFFTVILLSVFVACNNSTKKVESFSIINKTDSCSTNSKHTYRIYSSNGDIQNLPLFIAIDSHGSGETAINHLKEAVNEYPAVLVASNLIQNNDPNYIHELEELVADVQLKYSSSSEIYLTGFSGGARMALGYGTNHNVNGVIACGAFASAQQLSTIKCPVLGIVGMDDFNFVETVQFILYPDKKPDNTHVELMSASHEWPGAVQLANAFGWLRLQGDVNKNAVRKFSEIQKYRIDSLHQNSNFLQAACIARNMASVNAYNKSTDFGSIVNNIENDAAYKQQIADLVASLQLEMKIRQAYGNALMEKDEVWWKNEIAVLQNKIASEPNDMKQMMYKRINGYLGIVCYSYSRQFAARKDIAHLEQILMVYGLAEPENEDMIRFSKVLSELKK